MVVSRVVLLVAVLISARLAWQPGQIEAQGMPSSVPLSVRFVDVGRGDATWITTPDQRTVILDCGGAQFGPQLVLQLQSQGVQQVWQLGVSQLRPELVGGCVELLSHPGDLPVANMLWTGHQDSSSIWQAFWSLLPNSATPVKSGDALDWGTSRAHGAPIARVYNPQDATRPSTDPRDDGLVVLIEYAGRRILLVGEISDAAATRLAGVLPGKVDVMKVGNAGLDGGSSAVLLQAARPDTVVLSFSSAQGAPAPDHDRLARLASTGARVLSTADNGAVTVTVADDLVLRSER